MSAICLFGALCAVNQSVLQSNGSLNSFDPTISEVNSNYSSNVQSASESPCPSIFRYIQDSDEWYGEVILENIDLYKDIYLRLELTIDTSLLGKNDEAFDLTHDKESNNNQTLIYKVTFPTQNPVPKVKEIYYNEQLICSGPEDSGNASTTIKLIDVLKSRQSNLETSVRSNNETQFQAHKNKRQVEQEPELQFSNDAECGRSDVEIAQSLSIGGEKVSRGEWPWLVAFYGRIAKEINFICGGNLISKMLVITAAHCIQDKEAVELRKTTESFVYLGKHNLNDTKEPGFEKRGIKRFVFHPDWKPFDMSYDADIAIIVMDSPVEYSKYIKPICVWEFSEHLHDVVGQQGSLAGWGLNENFIVNSEYPKMIEVKVISDGTCFRKSPALAPFTSDRTFCAAGAKDEGPCQGDSGGGLILKKENKWYLRGLVSASERSKKDKCDPGLLVVFTDIAKYMSWIQLVELSIKTNLEIRKAVTRGQFPWIAVIYVSDGKKLRYTCSGSLISKLHVITKAFCVEEEGTKTKVKTSDLYIYLGKYKLNDHDEPGNEIRVSREIIIHPDWNTHDDADIAIIVMNFPLKYSEFIQSITIWEFSADLRDVVGQQGSIASWHYNKFLESSNLSIVDGESCNKIFDFSSEISSSRTFCAGGENEENACVGDSGSGLALKVKDKWYLRGMFSGIKPNNGSCDPNAPVLFIDIAKFVNWIASNTGV